MEEICHIPGQYEKDLLRKVAEDGERAFCLLYMRYHQQLGSYVYTLSDSMETAEEIVQDVFMKVWSERKSLLEVNNFKGYLFVVSKNYALNVLKKSLRERELKESYYKYYREFIGDEMSGMVNLSYYKLLDQAIDQLPPRQKEVFLMSRHKRMKYAEIASLLNLSPESIKKYLKLATAFIVSHVRKHVKELVSPVVAILCLFWGICKVILAGKPSVSRFFYF